jgi:prepilin-type N-terminal cleavage/methylation domain-containing protein
MKTTHKQGFTLIELLIVVAIIAILAAIAVPNFLEAQTRSKVSRVLADIRTMKVGMESYRVDNNDFPGFFEAPSPGFNSQSNYNVPSAGYALSTPVAYLTSSQFLDPFVPAQQSGKKWIVVYSSNADAKGAERANNAALARSKKNCYAFSSYGPDKTDNTQVNGWPYRWTGSGDVWAPQYDPTNGTVSAGDVMASEPKIPYIWKYQGPANSILPDSIAPFDE